MLRSQRTLLNMLNRTDNPGGSAPQVATAPPRDLVDFHLRWPEFRTLAARIAENEQLAASEREIVQWLLRLADRVGPRDLV